MKLVKVVGNSMAPYFFSGDIVGIFNKTPKMGDIVLFKKKGHFVLHRFIFKTPFFFIVKGDNSFYFDKGILKKDIVGVALWRNKNTIDVNMAYHILSIFISFLSSIQGLISSFIFILPLLTQHKKIMEKYFRGINVNLFNFLYELIPPFKKNIEFRELNEIHLNKIVKWKFNGKYSIYNLPANKGKYKKLPIYSKSIRRKEYFSIYVSGKFVGSCRLFKIKRKYFFGITLNPIICGKGYGQNIIRSFLNHIYLKNEIKNIYLRVNSFNVRAINCYIKSGFKLASKKTFFKSKKKYEVLEFKSSINDK